MPSTFTTNLSNVHSAFAFCKTLRANGAFNWCGLTCSSCPHQKSDPPHRSMDTMSQNVVCETCESSKRKREDSPDAEICCVLCQELLLDPVTLNCGHNFDASCMRDLLQSEFAGRCPTCRAQLTTLDPPQVRLLSFAHIRWYPSNKQFKTSPT